VVVGFFSTLLTSALILYPLYIFKILVIPRFLPTPILLAMAMAAVLNMIFIGALAVLLTHRIAGPMYSLARQMREIAAGQWRTSHLHLRKHDDLKYVMRNFNELVEGLIGLGEADLRMVDEIRERLKRHSGNDAGETASILELVERLRQRLGSRIEMPATPEAGVQG